MSREAIVLDEFGATLTPRPNKKTVRTSQYLGLHAGCHKLGGIKGHMNVRFHSRTHNCILCDLCSLRIVVPSSIFPLYIYAGIADEFFNELRGHFTSYAELEKQNQQSLSGFDVMLGARR